MIRLSKLTDYGIVLMTHMARGTDQVHTARELATRANLPPPTVSKLLKELLRAGLLSSLRGATGGYSLARPPGEISIADLIVALEGPVSITECTSTARGLCELEGHCPSQNNWQTINRAIHEALEKLTLAEMASANPFPITRPPRRNVVTHRKTNFESTP